MPYRQTKVSELKALHAALFPAINRVALPVEDQKAASIAATKQSRARVQTLKKEIVISQGSHLSVSKK